MLLYLGIREMLLAVISFSSMEENISIAKHNR